MTIVALTLARSVNVALGHSEFRLDVLSSAFSETSNKPLERYPQDCPMPNGSPSLLRNVVELVPTALGHVMLKYARTALRGSRYVTEGICSGGGEVEVGGTML